MIAGIFHKGSGLGNQLHRYVMARVLALDKGRDFGMLGISDFKANFFRNMNMGKPVFDVLKEHDMDHYTERRVNNAHGVDIRGYDWEGLLNIRDNTIIDGEFQGEKYYMHHRDRIDEWLHVPKPKHLPKFKDICVINFRGGEYTIFPDLFLRKEYWDNAIRHMTKLRPKMTFEVHTDDPVTASLFFPNYEIIRDMGLNWASIRHAKYLILSNSSFAILPAFLNDSAEAIIAPRGWARHNLGYWALRQNRMSGWLYQDLNGNLSYEDCSE